jgi:hypothetical protein
LGAEKEEEGKRKKKKGERAERGWGKQNKQDVQRKQKKKKKRRQIGAHTSNPVLMSRFTYKEVHPSLPLTHFLFIVRPYEVRQDKQVR